MPVNSTTVSGGLSATDTRVKLASAVGAAVNKFLKVDSEKMQIQNIDDAPTFAVIRGVQGTAAVPHANGAAATLGIGADFPPVPKPRQYSYTVAGPLVVAPGVHLISGAAAIAMTIRDPIAGAEDDLEMLIMSTSAFAHSVTNTVPPGSGFNAGAGGADAGTFGGAIGDNFKLRATNGKWAVQYLRNVTLA